MFEAAWAISCDSCENKWILSRTIVSLPYAKIVAGHPGFFQPKVPARCGENAGPSEQVAFIEEQLQEAGWHLVDDDKDKQE